MDQYKIWIFALVFLVACSQEEWMRKIAPPAQQDIVRGYIDQLRRGDFGRIKSAVDPSIAADLTDNTLEKMRRLIPEGAPTSVKLVGANRFSSDKVGTKLDLTYEYQFGEQYLLIHFARKMKDGVDTVIAIGVQPLRISLENGNRFTLLKKSVLQYAILGAAIAAPLFTLYALVICIRTKMERRKWLWILFIVFGFGKIMVNWTTGAWDFRILNLQLFCAAAGADFFGPWIIAVSLPVGAAVFLSRRKDLAVPTGDAEPAAAGPP